MKLQYTGRYPVPAYLAEAKKIKTKKTSHDVVWVANGFYAAVELDPYPPVWQGGQIAVITATFQKCGSLKGQCHEIFECWFFNPIASPGPMKGTHGRF